jgi:hypothetical protein
MAVRAQSSNPQLLLNQIKASIRNGSIQTWILDKDGDLTHSPQQWKNQAWFRPTVEPSALVFRILGPQSATMTTEVYAVYHGRLVEMLLAHFDRSFSSVSATAQAIAGEYISP